MEHWKSNIHALDLFCGAGGLSLGLAQSGVNVAAGLDLEEKCRFPYEHNLDARFIQADVRDVTGRDLDALWPDGGVRLLAGCAPCQPFSSQRRGGAPEEDKNWPLLGQFARLVTESLPDLVAMENVPRLASNSQFTVFRDTLVALGYSVAHGVLNAVDYGLPQRRKRLILIASRRGRIELPSATHTPDSYVTVDETIGHLPPVEPGSCCPSDPLHFTRSLSAINVKRVRASRPGGTWRDWPEELRLECHKRATGSSFGAFYGRMRGDAPAPTITTQVYNIGAGRFIHPHQDRALTLREAALLQGFPYDFLFINPGEKVRLTEVGKLIGNAVPPVFGRVIGSALREHVRNA